MKIVVTWTRAPWRLKAAEVMRQGLEAHGEEILYMEQGKGWVPPESADVVAIWSHHNRAPLLWARDNNIPYLVMEAGYFNDRNKFISLGWNGLNGRANFLNKNSPGDRWEKHGVEMRPWQSEGNYILIMGQAWQDASHRYLIDISSWYTKVIKEARKRKMQIFFRPHPVNPKGSPAGSVQKHTGNLSNALRDADTVVTFSSNSAVDAVLYGIPTCAYDEGSMAKEVASKTIAEGKVMPDRTQWAYNLAYAQWLPAEISSGEAWNHLKRYFDDKERDTVQTTNLQGQQRKDPGSVASSTQSGDR